MTSLLPASLAAGIILVAASAAQAVCFPVQTDVVSLGEQSARHYAMRSQERSIKDRKRTLDAAGYTITSVSKSPLSCAHFPNVLGTDEWRCQASARVCAKH